MYIATGLLLWLDTLTVPSPQTLDIISVTCTCQSLAIIVQMVILSIVGAAMLGEQARLSHLDHYSQYDGTQHVSIRRPVVVTEPYAASIALCRPF